MSRVWKLVFLLILPISQPQKITTYMWVNSRNTHIFLNPKRLAMEKLLEIIKTNLLTCNWGNQSGDIFGLCRRHMVSPHQAQGPPSLLSVPGHCSPAPVPNGLSCLTEGSSHIGQAQVGSRSQNMPFEFQASLITITTALGPKSSFQIQGYLTLAVKCFWGVSCSQLSNSKGTRSSYSQQSSPF